MKLLVALAAVLNIGSAFSPRAKGIENTGRIVNGISAHKGQFPFMAQIYIPNSDKVCGGSLIGSKWILTAAHCVQDRETIEVFLGSNLADDADVGYLVTKSDVKTHPNWFGGWTADIAVVQIPQTNICNSISTIPLPKISGSYQSYAGQRAVFTGWGVSQEPKTYPSHLQYAFMPIMSNEACSQIVKDLPSYYLCVDTSNHVSPCHGDSGGPLIVGGEQVGIMIKGSVHSCVNGYPAIFLRVTSYLSWIKSVTGISY